MKKNRYILLLFAVCFCANIHANTVGNLSASASLPGTMAMGDSLVNAPNAQIGLSAIDNMDYRPYIYSGFYSSVFLPSDEGLKEMPDPLTIGKEVSEMWQWGYDASKSSLQRIYVDVFACSMTNGGWVKRDSLRSITGGTGNSQINNRLSLLLDNIFVREPLRADKKYYKTKGNMFLKIDVSGTEPQTVEGPWDAFTQGAVKANSKYAVPAFEGRVCNVYVVDGPMMGMMKSIDQVLSEHQEFSEFRAFISAAGMMAERNTDGFCAISKTDNNLVSSSIGSDGKPLQLSLTDGDNYTLYVPTNGAMLQAYAAGIPSPSDLELAQLLDEKDIENGNFSDRTSQLRKTMQDFVRYHLQFESVFVDNGFENGRYGTKKFKTFEVTEADPYGVGAPEKLRVEVDSSHLDVTDAQGHTRHVVTTNGSDGKPLHNLMAVQLWGSGTNIERANTIENSSSIVIHAIDGPLMY